jgi:hypothetical protein
MRHLILISLLALIGCAKDCDCGIVVDDNVDCPSNCNYYLAVETDCNTEWVQVNQYTYLNTFVGDQFCK